MAKKFKNLQVSKKLMISYAIVLILLVLGIAVSIWNLTSIGRQVEEFYNGPFTVAASANVVNARFEQMQKSVYRAISNDAPAITEEAVSDAKAAADIIQQEMPIIKEHFLGGYDHR